MDRERDRYKEKKERVSKTERGTCRQRVGDRGNKRQIEMEREKKIEKGRKRGGCAKCIFVQHIFQTWSL